MARIAGVNLPREKRLEIALTYIYGIGPAPSRKVAAELRLSPDEQVRDLTAAELTPLREVDDHPVGDGRPGPITRAIQSVFEDALHGRSERYAHWLDVVPVPSPAP